MKKIISMFTAIVMLMSAVTIVDFSALADSAVDAPSGHYIKQITSDSVQIEWYMSMYAYCDYYEIAEYNDASKKYTKIATLKSNGKRNEKRTYTIKNLKQNTRYSFAVRACREDEDNVSYSEYTPCIEAYTAPKETSLKSVKYSAQGKINVQWTAVSGVSGYIIQYSTNKSFKDDGTTSNLFVTNPKSTSKTISALAQKTYYVRVCTYKKLSNKNIESGYQYFVSDYSRIKSVKVKKGSSIKTMLNSIKTNPSSYYINYIKEKTDNGVDVSKYSTTYDRFKAIYIWHAKHYNAHGWDCVGCNSNFNSCIDALFTGSVKEKDTFIRLAAGNVKNGNGSKTIHKWPVIYLSGVPYIFDPRLQGHSGKYTATTYFGIAKESSKSKTFLFDDWYSTYVGRYDDEFSREYIHAVPKPAVVSIASVEAKQAGFKVKWNKAGGAAGYQIQYSTSSSFSSAKNIYVNASTLGKTISGLGSNKTYYVRVRAYKKVNGKNMYGFWSSYKQVKTRHKNEANSTAVKKLTAGKGSIKAEWNKVSNASGYQIQYSTSSKYSKKYTKSVKVKKAESKSKKLSKLKKNKKYYVRVRTYRVVNGKTYYSAWSASKSVKTK